MKKGFTLVELLGVLITIGFISLITIPVVTSIIKNSKNRLYDTQVNLIIDAAKKYVLENVDDETKISKTLNNYLTVETLIKNGYLENKGEGSKVEIKDPRDESQIMNGCVTVKYKNNKFKYTYSDSTCEELNEGHAPTITINEKTIKIEVNSSFDLNTINSKVSAKTYDGESLEISNPVITKGGKVVSNVDTSILNARYLLTYTVTDPSNNLSAKDKIKIIINDTTAPNIEIPNSENNRITVKVGDRFTIPDAIVTDNSGEKIEAVATGTVDTQIVGTNTITYKAIDTSGNEATYILTVEVYE